jgi:hypothetical protein
MLMAANLLSNGSFTHGAEGFSTSYARGGTSLVSAGTYVVGTDPHLYHYAGADFGDHTTGTGKMLMVNGSPTAGTIIWRETINVTRGEAYNFSGFAASWATSIQNGGDISPAQVQVSINGTPISTTTLPSTPGQWISMENSWLATSSRAVITITDLNTTVGGNDSAYDDLSFTALASIHGSVITAALKPNGKVSGQHQFLAGATVFLDLNNDGIYTPGEPTATTTKSGTYVFTGLTAGTYQVCQLNPPETILPQAPLSVNVSAGKQIANEKIWDIYTAVVPTSGVFQ